MKRFLISAMVITLVLIAAQAQAQEYLGTIPFKNSEDVKIHFYVSEDAQKVEKLLFSVKKLYLEPESKKSEVESVTIDNASLGNESGYNIVDGKLTADSFFIFNLTVVDSCIYGTIGIKYDMDKGIMAADPVYVVIPNITTPQEIPENILKP